MEPSTQKQVHLDVTNDNVAIAKDIMNASQTLISTHPTDQLPAASQQTVSMDQLSSAINVAQSVTHASQVNNQIHCLSENNSNKN